MRSAIIAGIVIGVAVCTVTGDDGRSLAKQIVDASNKFAFELYDAIREEGKDNILISPLNIASCMGMLYMMASGTTAQELAGSMHFPTNQEDAAVGFQQSLKRLDEEALSWANGIFLNKHFGVKESYTKVLDKYWSAAARRLDFSREPQKSRELINGWVANRTGQMIKDLLPEGVPKGNTAMLLVSALHFKRPWSVEFNNSTDKGVFYLSNGETVNVDQIFAEADTFSHRKMNDIEADVLKIPYKGGKQSMIILQPFKNDGLPALEKRLKQLDLEKSVLKDMESYRDTIKLTLPKFKFEDSRTLQTPFMKLGMKRIFSSAEADFTKASDNRNLAVSEIYHKTMIVVDEKGTEAAGGTAIEVLESLVLPLTINIERPFLFVIREESSGLISFLGRFARP